MWCGAVARNADLGTSLMTLVRITKRAASGLAIMLTAACLSTAALGTECHLESGTARSVVKVIDSETLLLDDGKEVRLIGALGPRALDVGADPGTWPPEENAKAALAALVLNKSIVLAFGGDRTDRYDRWLAEVFVGDGEHQVWVQGHLLRSGNARSYAQSGNRACEAERLAHEKIARDAGLGLWREAAYQVRKPWPARELQEYSGKFQIIEGRVARVVSGHSAAYISFSRESRWAFSATIRQTDRAVLGRLGGDAKKLPGMMVEIRGWIEQRPGPTIDISTAGQIALRDGSYGPKGDTSDDATALPEPRTRRSRQRAPQPPTGEVPLEPAPATGPHQ